jgi:hypothetical protein
MHFTDDGDLFGPLDDFHRITTRAKYPGQHARTKADTAMRIARGPDHRVAGIVPLLRRRPQRRLLALPGRAGIAMDGGTTRNDFMLPSMSLSCVALQGVWTTRDAPE